MKTILNMVSFVLSVSRRPPASSTSMMATRPPFREWARDQVKGAKVESEFAKDGEQRIPLFEARENYPAH